MGDEEGEVAVNPATGDVYEGGRNEEGERHGEGVAKYANGDVYKVRCGPALTDAATRRTACRRLRRRRRLLRHTGLLATSCFAWHLVTSLVGVPPFEPVAVADSRVLVAAWG